MVRRFGEPDHALVRHAGAFVVEDHERLVGLCEEAAEPLRAEGRTYLADLYDIGVARALLALGRLDEHDELVDRSSSGSAHGPPTFLHWTLGHARLLQAPPAATGTRPTGSSPSRRPWRSRRAPTPAASRWPPAWPPRSGERQRAFRILGQHAADLLERRDLYEARLLCVDVVNLLVRAEGRLDDAARLLGYLAGTGCSTTPPSPPSSRDSADLGRAPVPDHDRLRAAGRRLDDGAALDLVRTLADELAREAS